MLIPYTAPEAPVRARTEIQKSIFIADLAPAASMEEAEAFWDACRKEFRDARHHCFACRIGAGQAREKSSDDGEPQGTAGHPMLRVLQMQDLTNTVLVVTRYFGGIKLGAGGLTRAYSGAAAGPAGKRGSSAIRPISPCASPSLTTQWGSSRNTRRARTSSWRSVFSRTPPPFPSSSPRRAGPSTAGLSPTSPRDGPARKRRARPMCLSPQKGSDPLCRVMNAQHTWISCSRTGSGKW